MSGDRSGYVYLIKCGQYYKIGRSKRVEDRIKSFGIVLPEPPRLLYADLVEDAAHEEKLLHVSFERYRTNGEWFRLTDDHLRSMEAVGGISGIACPRAYRDVDGEYDGGGMPDWDY